MSTPFDDVSVSPYAGDDDRLGVASEPHGLALGERDGSLDAGSRTPFGEELDERSVVFLSTALYFIPQRKVDVGAKDGKQ